MWRGQLSGDLRHVPPIGPFPIGKTLGMAGLPFLSHLAASSPLDASSLTLPSSTPSSSTLWSQLRWKINPMQQMVCSKGVLGLRQWT
ncbi:hypothetical protein A0H81_08820 [Grifola frondosa]|uniref:Uncharacterized protein n=1 Tax=Grifola frondosa TaxID=5627 RepID=A0A1C7M404_GRIFR|nr:hypothetical protein A0H81_08820 [Grifola frondosa]